MLQVLHFLAGLLFLSQTALAQELELPLREVPEKPTISICVSPECSAFVVDEAGQLSRARCEGQQDFEIRSSGTSYEVGCFERSREDQCKSATDACAEQQCQALCDKVGCRVKEMKRIGNPKSDHCTAKPEGFSCLLQEKDKKSEQPKSKVTCSDQIYSCYCER